MKTADDSLNIDILLPAKEAFSPANAGAVATYVHDITKASTSGHRFNIFGRAVSSPFPDINFAAIKPKMAWLFGKNIGFAMAYLRQLNSASQTRFDRNSWQMQCCVLYRSQKA